MSQRAPYHRHKAPPEPNLEAEDARLIEEHRDRVRDLEARGFLPSAIASVTKLPLRVVTAILDTKAPPKRGPK